MSAKNLESRCKAVAKSGKPCRAAATAGGLCFFHANPNKASELGRIGGKSNRHATTGGADPLPKLENAVAVCDALGQLIADVQAGKISPKVAAALAQLLSLQLRAFEAIAAVSPPQNVGLAEGIFRARRRVEEFRESELRRKSSALAGISSSSHQPGDTGQEPSIRSQAARNSI